MRCGAQVWSCFSCSLLTWGKGAARSLPSISSVKLFNILDTVVVCVGLSLCYSGYNNIYSMGNRLISLTTTTTKDMVI